MGRIRDAVLILFTNTCNYERRFQQMEQELIQLIIQQSDSMEKLNAWTARLAKREKRMLRDMDEILATPEVAPQQSNVNVPGAGVPPDTASSMSKYDRIRARRGGLAVPPGAQSPTLPEPETEKANGLRREETEQG